MLNARDSKLWRFVLRSVQPLFGRTPVEDTGDVGVVTRPTATVASARVIAGPQVIDLHEMTVAAAHRRSLAFLEQAQAAGYRQVRIITGKSGQIRREFPQWCETPAFRRHVRSFTACDPREGGDGAFLLTLVR